MSNREITTRVLDSVSARSVEELLKQLGYTRIDGGEPAQATYTVEQHGSRVTLSWGPRPVASVPDPPQEQGHTIKDLTDVLFGEIESVRRAQRGDDTEEALRKAHAIAALSGKVIACGELSLSAIRLLHGDDEKSEAIQKLLLES